jgi:hypothetical protein
MLAVSLQTSCIWRHGTALAPLRSGLCFKNLHPPIKQGLALVGYQTDQLLATDTAAVLPGSFRWPQET